MKRQANLLNFFKPLRCAICRTFRKTFTRSHQRAHAQNDKQTAPTDSNPTPSVKRENDANPTPQFTLTRPFLTGAPSLTFVNPPQTKGKSRQQLTARRRSSTKPVKPVSLTSDETAPSSTVTERDNRLVNASAKLRKGNYDGLNYAPCDQYKPTHPPPAFRSRWLDKLTVPSESSSPKSRLNGIKSSPALQSPSHIIESSLTQSPVFDSKCPSSVSSQDTEPLRPPPSLKLDSQEESALQDLLHDIKSPIRTPKTVSKTAHRKATPRTSQCKTESLTGGVDNSSAELRLSLTERSILDTLLNNNDFNEWNSFNEFEIEDRIYLLASLLDGTINNRTSSNLNEVSIELLDSWNSTDVAIDDVVHLISGPHGRIGRHFVISDQMPSSNDHRFAALVYNPDSLLSGTKIVESLRCPRRHVLEEFWPGSFDLVEEDDANVNETPFSGVGGGTDVMLLGSVVHELFQKAVSSSETTVEGCRNILRSCLYTSNRIMDMYSSNMTYSQLFEKAETFIGPTLNWIRTHVRGNNCKPASANPSVPILTNVVDIEENFWCVKFGIKGRIDLTGLCQLPHSHINSLLPIELKTGKPTYSIEHQGQVLLYMLMLSDRYGPHYNVTPTAVDSSSLRDDHSAKASTARAGWLLYLKQSNESTKGLLYPNQASWRSLLQSRNSLAHHIDKLLASVSESSNSANWTSTLPARTQQERTCQYCPLQLTCAINSPAIHDDAGFASHSVVESMLASVKAHLTSHHLVYFHKWSHLLLVEHLHSDRLDKTVGQIVEEGQSLDSSTDNLLRQLAIESCVEVSDQWKITLRRSLIAADLSKIDIVSNLKLSPGDFVIVSSDDGRLVGITLASIVSCEIKDSNGISPNLCIVLSTDRRIPQSISFVRLDRYASPKTTQLNLSNLVGLASKSTVGEFLRNLIVDGGHPRFQSTFCKQVVDKIRDLLKPLNQCQRTVIIRFLLAQDYLLVNGYPGSGKTQTLASLLRVLVMFKKRVLVVAHTHSAVDTLLSKLIELNETSILRLGNPDRVSAKVRPFSLEQQLDAKMECRDSNELDPTQFLDNLIKDKLVVGCTALSASGGPSMQHSALSRLRFDVVLVDEASQLLLPTSIGPLLCLSSSTTSNDNTVNSTDDNSTAKFSCGRFILVGDCNQLPPLVRSKQARNLQSLSLQRYRLNGLDTSLFTYLKQLNDARLANPVDDGDHQCVVDLNLQYRMNEVILDLANSLAYDKAMRCATPLIAKSSLESSLGSGPLIDASLNPAWLTRALSTKLNDSLLFLDTRQSCSCSKSSTANTKFHNLLEASLIVSLIKKFISAGADNDQIGVIAPYRAQVAAIKRKLQSDQVEINTVDQFQGRDKQIILISLTCTPKDVSCDINSTNLLDNLPRLTVALTRAKHKLILVGCSRSIEAHNPGSISSNEQPLGLMVKFLSDSQKIELLPSGIDY